MSVLVRQKVVRFRKFLFLAGNRCVLSVARVLRSVPPVIAVFVVDCCRLREHGRAVPAKRLGVVREGELMLSGVDFLGAGCVL